MTNKPKLYPLQFDFTYQRKIWGGDKIFKYKKQESPYNDIGETWEISPMQGEESIVSNGILKGKTLPEVVAEYGADFLGKQVLERFDAKFPLLIKLIDANQDLSVQVHPNDEYAKKHHNSWGKTEMWYLLDCTPNATIYAGWKKQTNPEQLKEIVQTDEVMDYLAIHKPQVGDVFYLPAGKVHTIGAGCLILEIQQASDITYRMFDFNRVDDNGNKRELHIEQAAAVTNYEVDTRGSQRYDRTLKDKPVLLAESDYFKTHRYILTKPIEWQLAERDSFTFLFVEEGTLSLTVHQESYLVEKGGMLLLPAAISTCYLEAIGGIATLIECSVPKR